jgi:hypothetical protein
VKEGERERKRGAGGGGGGWESRRERTGVVLGGGAVCINICVYP